MPQTKSQLLDRTDPTATKVGGAWSKLQAAMVAFNAMLAQLDVEVSGGKLVGPANGYVATYGVPTLDD
jgi:hypothetical protein